MFISFLFSSFITFFDTLTLIYILFSSFFAVYNYIYTLFQVFYDSPINFLDNPPLYLVFFVQSFFFYFFFFYLLAFKIYILVSKLYRFFSSNFILYDFFLLFPLFHPISLCMILLLLRHVIYNVILLINYHF